MILQLKLFIVKFIKGIPSHTDIVTFFLDLFNQVFNEEQLRIIYIRGITFFSEICLIEVVISILVVLINELLFSKGAFFIVNDQGLGICVENGRLIANIRCSERIVPSYYDRFDVHSSQLQNSTNSFIF